MVGIVSLQHFLCCVDKGLSEGLPLSIKWEVPFSLGYPRPPPLQLTSPLFWVYSAPGGKVMRKICSALLGVLPSVHFCAWEQTHGLTLRFPLLIFTIACLVKNAGSQGYCVPKGKYASFGSCTSLCGWVLTLRCLQSHLLRFKYEKVAKLFAGFLELHIECSCSNTHLSVPKNHPIEGKRKMFLDWNWTLVILKKNFEYEFLTAKCHLILSILLLDSVPLSSWGEINL